VKLLVDMNLSPSGVDKLAHHGFEAVHWSTIGRPLRQTTRSCDAEFAQLRLAAHKFHGDWNYTISPRC
jgi:predicted nuclease of predicted toxin-antitoxin system